SKAPEDRYTSAGDFGRAALAGAAGRKDEGSARTVATGRAALLDAQELADGARVAAAVPAAAAPTAAALGRRPTGRVLISAATVIVIAAAAAVAIAVGGGGSTRPRATTPPTSQRLYAV